MSHRKLIFVLGWILCAAIGGMGRASAQAPVKSEIETNTFSIVGYDPDKQEWGCAVASKVLGVGAGVPWAKANVGAIATQALTNRDFGPNGLVMLAGGSSPEEVLKKFKDSDPNMDVRQIGIIDAKGNAVSFTGAKCSPWAGHKTGKNYACQGNLLAGEAVVNEMARAFEDTPGRLAGKLIAALVAGDKAGGDKRGKQSAAIVVVADKTGGRGGANDRYLDLRVDDHPEPVAELARLLDLRQGPKQKKKATLAPRLSVQEIDCSTFSIVAYDSDKQEWGCAVASKYLGVGNVVPHARAGAGVVATQASVNIAHGPNGVERLAKGMSAEETLQALKESDPKIEVRQLGIVDAKGNAATFTGKNCIAWAGGKTGKYYACQGNILAGPNVVDDMAKAFEETPGPLAWRMMAALTAGDKAGGDKRGKQSAAILVVRDKRGPNGIGDRYLDFRVDDHQEPVPELARILALRLPRPKSPQ
jgi:uncharacterized Ntn-hydrolase superfamily protein